MTRLQALLAVGAMSAALAGFSPAPKASAQLPGWRYCSSAPAGKPVAYFSRVFASDTSVYHVGVANSFNGHVAARHDPEIVSGAICAGLFDTAQQAEDDLNEQASRWRRNGRDVIFTRWIYRGD
ncbi:hypothetical protein D3C72_405530 [compost metagenome]